MMDRATRGKYEEPRLRRAGNGSIEADEDWDSPVRNERQDERTHIRVRIPFEVSIGGRRLGGHDISVSGLSTVKRPRLEPEQTASCEIAIRCNGFRATIPATVRMLGTGPGNRGARFEFVEIGESELSILRRLIRAHLAGVHLTLDQLSASEDSQTVRERVKRTIRPPNPTPSLFRFLGTVGVIAVLLLTLGAALYERMFVIEPNFAAVTAPEIKIFAPTDGELGRHDFNAGDRVTRDQVLVNVQDPEVKAQLVLAKASLKYNERLIENLRASLKKGKRGSVAVTSGGGAPVMMELTPLEMRARIKEFESTYEYSKANIQALEARAAAGKIHAPCECIVHSIRSGDGGYWVQKGALIAQLIETGADQVTVEALVHLDEISGIEPNERAEVVMPTTGETLVARVASIQLESQNIERAGFPEWARQDMSHGSVILAMEDSLPPGLVGHPVEVRFIDTDSGGGRAMATIFGTLSDFLREVTEPIASAIARGADRRSPDYAGDPK